MSRILVTGALGQIGTELVAELAQRHGAGNIVASDLRMPQATRAQTTQAQATQFELVDCTQPHQLHEVVRRHEIGVIYHLAALLSATAEDKPQVAWAVNMGGLYNILEVARQTGAAVFFPSSIGAFGPSTPRDATPQVTIQRPTTMYGVTKAAGEMLCEYYARRFGLDVRGVRLPGLISYAAPPGGGTTDYAVDIFRHALRYRRYTCFLGPDTRLDMMYMPDAIRAIVELMAAARASLVHANAYNIAAMNFTPAELAQAIARRIAGFSIDYEIDPIRQAIADSWPRSLDDTAARAEWGWRPRVDIESMCDDMIARLSQRMTAAAPSVSQP